MYMGLYYLIALDFNISLDYFRNLELYYLQVDTCDFLWNLNNIVGTCARY